MKITVMAPPGLCQLPLLAAPGSTHGGIQLKRRSPGFLVRIIAKARKAITSRVPVGYEDGTGFHHGVAPDPGHRI